MFIWAILCSFDCFLAELRIRRGVWAKVHLSSLLQSTTCILSVWTDKNSIIQSLKNFWKLHYQNLSNSDWLTGFIICVKTGMYLLSHCHALCLLVWNSSRLSNRIDFICVEVTWPTVHWSINQFCEPLINISIHQSIQYCNFHSQCFTVCKAECCGWSHPCWSYK